MSSAIPGKEAAMARKALLSSAAAPLLLTFMAGSASAQFDSRLDVPFVPTREEVVQSMLDMAEVEEGDLLYDLGSGDGRIVITAAKERGVRGVGIDLDPQRIREARANARQEGVEDKVEFIQGNLFNTDFSKATVVTMYLLPDVNLRLRPRILRELEPGTRVVSHAFDMNEWQPDEKARVEGSYIYMWIVPARVAGAWEWETDDGSRYQVELDQQFQEVSGKAWVDGRAAHLTKAELRGDRLQLTIQPDGSTVPQTFTARYDDGRLLGLAARESGQAAEAEQVAWVAERAEGGSGG